MDDSRKPFWEQLLWAIVYMVTALLIAISYLAVALGDGNKGLINNQYSVMSIREFKKRLETPVTKEELDDLKRQWRESPESKDKAYLATPEGHLMQAIFGN